MWFNCDVNAVPPAYVLQPISCHIPNNLCHDADERKLALQQWKRVFAQIQNILRREATKLLGDRSRDQLHKYFMSGKTPFVFTSLIFFARDRSAKAMHKFGAFDMDSPVVMEIGLTGGRSPMRFV